MKRTFLYSAIVLSISAPVLYPAQSGKIVGWGSQVVGGDMTSGFVAGRRGQIQVGIILDCGEENSKIVQSFLASSIELCC